MPEPKRSPLTQSDRPTAFSAVAGLAQTVTNADVKGKSLETSGGQVRHSRTSGDARAHIDNRLRAGGSRLHQQPSVGGGARATRDVGQEEA